MHPSGSSSAARAVDGGRVMSAISSVAQPARIGVRRLTASRHAVALSGILALSAFLNAYKLTQNGYANTYYAAAVRSMLLNWRNFFFVSFDPGGLVSVDKPPLALWVEAASAKLFGFSSASILLPEALAGVASVGPALPAGAALLRSRRGAGCRARAGRVAGVGRGRPRQQPRCAVRVPARRRRVCRRPRDRVGTAADAAAGGGADGPRLRDEDARCGDHRPGHRARLSRVRADAVAHAHPPLRRWRPPCSSPCPVRGSRSSS